MRPIAFCDRCRGMEVGCNRKYLTHGLVCGGGLSKSLKILIYTAATALFISTFPTPTAVEYSDQTDVFEDRLHLAGETRQGLAGRPSSTMKGMAMLAVVPMVMPTDWMAAINDRLGLVPLPRSPLTEYLTRSLSAVATSACPTTARKGTRRWATSITDRIRKRSIMGGFRWGGKKVSFCCFSSAAGR